MPNQPPRPQRRSPGPDLFEKTVDELLGSTRPDNLPPAESSSRRWQDKAKIMDNRQIAADGTGQELDVEAKKKRAKFGLQSRDWWVQQGYVYLPVDRYNAFSGMTTDLAGLFDAIAFRAGEQGIIGIQFTSTNALSSHVTKACKDEPIKETGTSSKTTRQAYKRPNKTRREILREWLGSGNRALICTYDREGAYEVPAIFELTEEVIQLKVSGKRMSFK